MKICQKNLTPHILPFKVTDTNMDQSTTYDFLLMIHSNHGPISYCFRDKMQYLQNSPTPVYILLPLRGP